MSENEAPRKRGVRLSTDEAWEMIEHSHTGVFTTLRKDGVPISLPVWFIVFDRRIYVGTPGGSKKIARVRHDSRAAFLVESGELWRELKAVHLTGRATVVDDPELGERFRAASEEKYGAFRMAPEALPRATVEHYARSRAVVCFEPDERVVSWDNARLFGG
jgi:nitroimidazol reductase NimA-like FMN-containing flavoprotein (pyridoxamine 5'-phosphate oxidase superfamily)